MTKKLSRRDFLKVAGVTSASFALSACGVKAIELSTPTSTLAPTPAPSATPSLTPIPTIQVGGISVPDPKVTNPELFDIQNPSSPILQFVSATEMAESILLAETIFQNLEYQIYKTENNNDFISGYYKIDVLTQNSNVIIQPPIPLLFAQSEKENWKWKQNGWRDIADKENFLVGVSIDAGHPNHNDPEYLDFIFENTNLITIAGGLMHKYMEYGKVYVPQVLKKYFQVNPNAPLAIQVHHLFWHQDSFPSYLTDTSLSLESRQEKGQEYMKERIREVIDVLLPYLDKLQKVILVLANEVFWEFQGNVGWTGEYGGHPLYALYGEKWVAMAYKAFDDVVKEYIIPRDNFILLLNDYQIEIPNLKADFYLRQRDLIISQISDDMGISPDKVQLDIGIQFGQGYGDQFGQELYNMTKRILATISDKENGHKEMATHLNKMGEKGNIFITEFGAKGSLIELTEFMNNTLDIFSNVGNIKAINLWDALNFDSTSGSGNIVIIKSPEKTGKTPYTKTLGYFSMSKYLLQKAAHV